MRPARPAEAEALSTLALRSKAHWGYSSAFMEACRDELTYRADDIASASFRFVVAEVDAAIVGFYALERLSAEEVELEALFVEPSHIGCGWGRALITHARQEAAKWGASTMTIQGDPHAEAFYRAAGGVRTGHRVSASVPGRYLPVFTIEL